MKLFKTFIIVCIFLVKIQAVNALAVTKPIPSNITLKNGESLQFNFDIQAVTSKEDLICTYSTHDLKPLIINFNEEKSVVKAGGIKEIFGTIEIPFHASVKEYIGNLIVSCEPVTGTEGVSIIAQTIEVPFRINVINIEESYKKGFIEILIIITISVLLILYKFKSKTTQKQQKKKKLMI